MNQYLPIAIEVVVMMLLWLLPRGLTRPLNRRHGVPKSLVGLLRFLLQPILVLVLTWSVIVILRTQGDLVPWLDAHASHLDAWTIFWAGVAMLLLIEGGAHVFFARQGRELPVPGLLMGIIRVVLVVGLAFGVLRFELGLDIAPLLASTALLTAVIGFALQGVLGNLLAGMSLHITRSVMPGDWVDMEGITGKVTETNWRETRIRTMSGHVMIVPNAKVSEAVVHNLVRPNPVRRHKVDVGASYADAPDEVIAALVAAAKEVEAVLPNPQPDAYVTAFQDFGINYRLRYWTRDYHRREQIDGEVNRMIWYKFKRAGIEIPFPMSDVLLNDYLMLVQNQMKLDPKDELINFITCGLRDSDLTHKLVVDEDGRPLLDAEQLQNIAPLVRKVRYTKGETLFHQGDEGNSCHILVEGGLAGRVLGKKKEVIVEFTLDPGTLVGEMSLMLDMPRSAEIRVTEPSILLEIGPEAFRALLTLDERIPAAFARLAAERAESNKAAMEDWAAAQAEDEEVEITEKGFLKRFMRLMRR